MKKSKTRIFVFQTISSNLIVDIRNKQHHFLKNVLRTKINDKINIFDGKTGEWEAFISSQNRDNTVLQVVEKIRIQKKSPDIWLILAPIKQHRMNLAVQKATELGVSKIIPCITAFTNIEKVNFRKLKDNVVEAVEQSKRLDLPTIEKEVSLQSLLANWTGNRKLIYCDETLDKKNQIIDTLLSYKNSNNKWAVIIGPEGGFSNIEKNLITNTKNVIPVSLGERVLRSDTAITVALFCLQEILS